MFKKIISLCITVVMLSSSFVNIVFAKDTINDNTLSNEGMIELIDENGNKVTISEEELTKTRMIDGEVPVEISNDALIDSLSGDEQFVENSGIELYDPNKDYAVGDVALFGEDADDDGKVELFMSATYQGKCLRYWENVYGKKSYMYASATATSYVTWNQSGQTFYTEEIWYTSTGVYRYKSTNSWKTPSGVVYDAGWFEKTSADTWTTYHTYTGMSGHYSSGYHYDLCDYCGTYGSGFTRGNCYSCYPAKIDYNANGGSGAPSDKTVTSSSAVTISSTMPSRFKYKFRGWSTSSSATSGNSSYDPGKSVYLDPGETLTLYAAWEGYYTLSGNYDSDFTYIEFEDTMGYFRFSPSESGTYVFKTINSSGDPDAYLYNSSGSELADDGGSGNDEISYYLYSGSTYYYGVELYNDYGEYIDVEIRRQYDITYDANGGSGAPSSQTKLHGNNLTLRSGVPVRNLWQFKGWATNSTSTTAQYQAGGTYSGNGNQTLYAVWGYPTGSCGTSATWTFSPEDKSLTISGSGAMTDYSASNNAPWNEYAEHIETIVVDSGITTIGKYAFSGCNKVTEVTLPDSLTAIGEYAFSNCSALTTVSIPAGVKTIEKYTFNNCSSLSGIEIKGNVTTIGDYAFYGCSSVSALELPATVTSIGTYAFANCSKLTSINIPAGVTTIEAYTFSGDRKLAGIEIPDTVQKIKEFAFSECAAVTEFIIPNSVTEIEKAAFSNCSALKTVTIPDSVTTIGTSIFAYVKDNVTIKCYIDTVAHAYAEDNDINYELMSWGALEKPTFSKTKVIGGVKVSISAPRGTIYYTTNNTTPTTKSNVYSAPIEVNKNTTIKAIVVDDGWDDSPVSTYKVELDKVSAPYGSVESGSAVKSGTKVELYCETDGVAIWFTTDRSVPTSANVYKGAITINEDTTIYAMAVKNGYISSDLTVLNYTISNAEDTPDVITLDATNITETSAKVSAEIDANNGVIYDVQFVYYEKNNSSVKYTVKANAENNAVLTGLAPDTEYWYQVRAINEKGWSYGYLKSFKTDAQGIIKPASIEIDPSYLKINVGKKKTLLATVLPMSADSRDVYWSSEDPSVATVDKNGVVTAVGLGNTRIKATTVSNRLVAYCNVDVISSDVRGEFDFSEHNMITNSSYFDEHGFDHSPSEGGNALMASAYLARWDGAVLEENDVYPYPSKNENIKKSEVPADYHVQNIIYLPYRQGDLDNNEIKKAVMTYGAVYTAFKVGITVDEYGRQVYKYFNDKQSTYYYPPNSNLEAAGHAVVIVGWDDNYPRSKFDVTPEGDGAFICKNSWGTQSGEDGYFYVSYYDKYIARANCDDYNAVFYSIEGSDNYNKIYQYDYLGPVAANDDWGVKTLYTANVFPEAGKSLQEAETLKAVSFYNYAPGTPYEIYIVTNYQDAKSLTELGSPVKTGVSEYAGYLTVNLDDAIELASGTRFAVVVKCTAPSGLATIFIEAPMAFKDGTPHSTNAKANKDESYIGMDKKTWQDLTEYIPNANLCIKAFTETDDNSVLLQGIDNVGRTYTDDTILKIEEWKEKGMIINDRFIEFHQNAQVELFANAMLGLGSAPPTVLPDLNTNNNYAEGSALPAKYDLREEECMTSVKNQGEIGSCWSFATYASLESAIKKASFLASSSGGDGLNQAPGTATSVDINTTGAMLALGSTLQLSATVYPLDSTAEIIWSSGDNSVVSVSAHGLVRAVGVGDAIVTAATLDGSASVQCAITVTSPVKVDSISINNGGSGISCGDQLLIDYTVYPENAGDKSVLWEVSDSDIATINEYGLLTATGNGTVMITAYSADRSVSTTYQLEIDDGFDCQIDITKNNLAKYDTNIFGSIEAVVENKTNNTIDATIVMAIYDAEGNLVKTITQKKSLAPKSNPVDFQNVYIANVPNTKLTVKMFVWDSLEYMQNIAAGTATVIE